MTIPILVSAGPSLDLLEPLSVNADSTPLEIRSDNFHGRVTVRLSPYYKQAQSEPDSGYFDKRDGSVTWSIAVEGRFMGDFNADEILFGNIWQQPIRDRLPYGTAIGINFVKLIDPSLSHDLYADQPWAASPLLATMNYVSTSKLDSGKDELPTWNSSDPILDNVVSLFEQTEVDAMNMKHNAPARKKYFADQKRREAVKITKNDIIACDFCNGYIDFSTLSLKLPVGLSVSLKEHWDGQPITFICQSRDKTKTFFVFTFQIGGEGDIEADLSEADEAVPEPQGKTEAQQDKDDMGVD